MGTVAGVEQRDRGEGHHPSTQVCSAAGCSGHTTRRPDQCKLPLLPWPSCPQYLKYIAWALSDKVGLNQLQGLVGCVACRTQLHVQSADEGCAELCRSCCRPLTPTHLCCSCHPCICPSSSLQEPRVRLAAVNALLALYSDPENKAALQARQG